jgi:hypothetical protein
VGRPLRNVKLVALIHSHGRFGVELELPEDATRHRILETIVRGKENEVIGWIEGWRQDEYHVNDVDAERSTILASALVVHVQYL